MQLAPGANVFGQNTINFSLSFSLFFFFSFLKNLVSTFQRKACRAPEGFAFLYILRRSSCLLFEPASLCYISIEIRIDIVEA